MKNPRQIALCLHDGGSIVMQADGPEEELPFDGLGGLLCLERNEAETGFADAELVTPDRLPEDLHTLRAGPLTETTYTAAVAMMCSCSATIGELTTWNSSWEVPSRCGSHPAVN